MTDEQPQQPEHQRGVYGVHGDNVNRIFVLHRLMQAVQPEMLPTYQVADHWDTVAAGDLLVAAGDAPVVCAINPGIVGPTHVLIGAWRGLGWQQPLRLLRRLELTAAPDEILATLRRILDDLKIGRDRDLPGMVIGDPTGAGIGIVRALADTHEAVFPVSLAEQLPGPGAATVIDAATDILRELVDSHRLIIGDDHPLIDQMGGQTWTEAYEPVDAYGRKRRVYSSGEFEVFNTLRLLVLSPALLAPLRRPPADLQVEIKADASAFISAVEAAFPPAGLYDIGGFLAGALNMTVEQAREFVDRCLSSYPQAERDQDHTVEVPYDFFLDLAEGFDRLVAMWEDDQHTLVTADNGWSIEHPLRCRAGGNMAGCRYHEAVADAEQLGVILPGPGRFLIGLDVNVSDEITFEPAP